MLTATIAVAAALATSALPSGHPAWTYEGDALGVAPDGTAYVGATSLVAVTGSTPVFRLAGGAADTAWPDVPRATTAAADGHGGFYAGATDGRLASTATVQHVLASRAVDGRFKVRLDREPTTVVAAGGLVIVAGPFKTVNGQPRAGLAALDAASGALAAWNPSPDGPVHALADGGDGTVFVAGEFSHLSGAVRNGLAQLALTSGAPTPWNPAPAVVTGAPLALAVTPGTVVLGGGFLWFLQRREVSRLAAIDRATAAVTSLGPVDSVGAFAGGEISDVAALGGTAYATGDLSTAGQQKHVGVAAFDLASGRQLPWAPADDGEAYHVVATPAGVLVAADHVRLLDPATGTALPFSPIAGAGPLVVLGDELLVVETSHQVGLGEIGGLAAIGTDGRPRPSFSAPGGLRYVRALRAGSALFAFACPPRGCGNGAAGISRVILRLDPATGARASWKARAAWPSRVPRRDGWTIGDAVADGRTLDVLILFLPAGSSQPSASAIESFDVASGRRLGTALQLPTGAPAIALALVRSGRWLVAGGLADDRGRALARLDPRSLRPRPWSAAPIVRGAGGQPGAIGELAAAAGRVYLLGPFTSVGGASRSSRLAAVSAASGRVVPFAPRLGRSVFVEHLAACPGFVAVTGSGREGNVDALLDPASGRPLPWTHPTLGGPVFAGPAGLLSVAGGGPSLFPGALGSCAPG